MTDVEGSTQSWEQFPDQMVEALRVHDSLAENICEQNNGYLIKKKGEGDALFMVFQEPEDGVRAAVQIQRAYQNAEWPEPVRIRVRMALHVGICADARDGDYFGPVVNRCARIKAIGHAGQILVSGDIAYRTKSALESFCEFKALGEHRLKSLDSPIEIFQVIAPGIPTDFPKLDSLSNYPHNLPFQASSFIGRSDDLVKVRTSISQKHLTVLVGMGGTGKSRLAIHAGAEVVQDFPGGVWIVEVDLLTTYSQLEQAITDVVNLSEKPGLTHFQLIEQYVIAKRTCFIFDNCEHLLIEVSKLASKLIASCPTIRILVTSRETIKSSIASIIPIFPLELPNTICNDDQVLLSNPSVQLFIERADNQGGQGFHEIDNLKCIANICSILEGVPFMIELAAARAQTVPLPTILTRIEDRFRILGKNSLSKSTRHQTLRALIDWSYELLSDTEKLLFCRLSVFQGGWTLETCEAVAGLPPLEPFDIIDDLGALVDKSLVRMDHISHRYSMLETVRLYARELLVASGEYEQIKANHSSQILLHLELSGDQLPADESRQFEQIDLEIRNLRSAMVFLADTDAQAALNVALNLFRYSQSRARYSETRAFIEGLLSDQRSSLEPKQFGQATNVIGNFARLQGDFETAITWFKKSQAAYAAVEASDGECAAIVNQATTYLHLGQSDEAESLAIQGNELAERFQNHRVRVTCQLILGNILSGRKDLNQARCHFEFALQATTQHGLSDLKPFVAVNLGLNLSKQNDFQNALNVFKEVAVNTETPINRGLLLDCFRFSASAMTGLHQFTNATKLYAIEARLRLLHTITLSEQDQTLLENDIQILKRELTVEFDVITNYFEKVVNEIDLWTAGKQLLLETEAL